MLKCSSFVRWTVLSLMTFGMLLGPVSHRTSVAVAVGGADVYTYITDFWRHSVVVMKNLQIVDSILTSGEATNTLDITPDHTRIYATRSRGNIVSALVVDPSKRDYGKEVAVIKTAGIPMGIKVHPDGLKAYVAVGRGIVVIESDPDSPTYNTITRNIALSDDAFDLDFSVAGDQLFVIHTGAPPNNLSVIETTPDTLSSICESGRHPVKI